MRQAQRPHTEPKRWTQFQYPRVSHAVFKCAMHHFPPDFIDLRMLLPDFFGLCLEAFRFVYTTLVVG